MLHLCNKTGATGIKALLNTGLKMTSANSKVKARINEYILNAIDGECYDRAPQTDQQKLLFLATTFKSEYCYRDNFKRYGTVQTVLAQWLMGLPSAFSIAFYNDDIINTSISFGNLPDTLTESQKDKIIAGWFMFIAGKILQLMNSHGISHSFFLENLKK